MLSLSHKWRWSHLLFRHVEFSNICCKERRTHRHEAAGLQHDLSSRGSVSTVDYIYMRRGRICGTCISVMCRAACLEDPGSQTLMAGWVRMYGLHLVASGTSFGEGT
jgi:hypothetical protein